MGPWIDPWVGRTTLFPGRPDTRPYTDPVGTVRQWRSLARRNNLSLRDLVIEVTSRPAFIGTPATVAAGINALVQQDAVDGILTPPFPGGLDEFTDKIVPLLQERGVFRSEYQEDSLRERLSPEPRRARTVPLPRPTVTPVG